MLLCYRPRRGLSAVCTQAFRRQAAAGSDDDNPQALLHRIRVSVLACRFATILHARRGSPCGLHHRPPGRTVAGTAQLKAAVCLCACMLVRRVSMCLPHPTKSVPATALAVPSLCLCLGWHHVCTAVSVLPLQSLLSMRLAVKPVRLRARPLDRGWGHSTSTMCSLQVAQTASRVQEEEAVPEAQTTHEVGEALALTPCAFLHVHQGQHQCP